MQRPRSAASVDSGPQPEPESTRLTAITCGFPGQSKVEKRQKLTEELGSEMQGVNRWDLSVREEEGPSDFVPSAPTGVPHAVLRGWTASQLRKQVERNVMKKNKAR